jgi:DNA helicase HerA-like ATPase
VRSKGVGVYFITQNPLDVPDVILGQLGNRVQHALRAFTPRDQKAVNAAADTFRGNPKLNVQKVIMEMGVGEALVSFLDAKGAPGIVQRAFIIPPTGQIGPITADQRQAIIKGSVVFGHYEQTIDRESAYERLKGSQQTAQTGQQAAQTGAHTVSLPPPGRHQASEAEKLLGAMAQSAVRSVGTQIGRQVVRGIMGSIFGGMGKR